MAPFLSYQTAKLIFQKMSTNLLLTFISQFYCQCLPIYSSLFCCFCLNSMLIGIFLKPFKVIIVSLLFVSIHTVFSFPQQKSLANNPLIHFMFDKFSLLVQNQEDFFVNFYFFETLMENQLIDSSIFILIYHQFYYVLKSNFQEL